MNEVWDGSRMSGELAGEYDTCLMVAGSVLPLEEGDSLASKVLEAAGNAGFGKFRVFVNGAEVVPSAAPTLVKTGDKIEVRPYDVAGQ